MERVANARPEANPSSRELRRTALRALVESKGFGQVVMAVIVINAITLGLETSERAVAAAGPLLTAIDRAALPALTEYWVPEVDVTGVHELVANALNLTGQNDRTTDLRGEELPGIEVESEGESEEQADE